MEVLVVGCGFAGSVIARFLAEECNKKVLIVDKRDHIAGNMYDFVDENGILVQKYGPHIFHTNQKHLYDYVIKYGEWNEYYLNCMAYMEDQFSPSPFNFATIDQYYTEDNAAELKERILKYYNNAEKATILELLECKDDMIKEYAQFLYDKDYSLYTAKQWGISPDEIDKEVLRRVPVVFSYKTGYFDDKYQCMPKNGFTSFFSKILEHKNIEVRLNTNAKSIIDIKDDKIYIDGKESTVPVIYSGALDELLDYKFELLPYRSLRFEYITKNVDSYQPAPVVAYPQVLDYTRITEYKKLNVQNEPKEKTTIAVEYPLKYTLDSESEPYYPILTEENVRQYNLYREQLSKIENLFICGRLADFKYYNMDQILDRSLQVCEEIKSYLERV